MISPYYEESADRYLNLGGTAVIFALSIFFILRAFFYHIGNFLYDKKPPAGGALARRGKES